MLHKPVPNLHFSTSFIQIWRQSTYIRLKKMGIRQSGLWHAANPC